MGGRAGAPQSRADADRMGDLSRRRALHLGRSVGLPARRPSPTPGRSAIPIAAAEAAPDPPRRLVGGARTSRPRRRSWTTVIAAQKEAESHGTLHRRPHPVGARHVRGRLRGDAAAPAPPAPAGGESEPMPRRTHDRGDPRRHGRLDGARRQRRRVRRGRRLLRRRVPLHRGPAAEVRHAAAASTRRSARAASSAPPSAWRPTACGPCVEIQFADYMYPAYDQIVSEAARLRYRSAGDFTAPMVIRMPTRRRHLRRPDAQPEPGGAVHPRLRA